MYYISDQPRADDMPFFDWDAPKGKRNLAALGKPRPDASMKEYWHDDSHFSDFINAYFYGGKKEVLPKELSVMDSVVLTAENALSAEGIPDIVRCWTRTGSGGETERWIFFLENQMYLDRGMVMRVSFNKALIARQEWRKLRDAHKENRKQDPPFLSSVGGDVEVPGISGLVIYYGSQPWDMPTKPSDLMSSGVLIPRPEAVDDRSINVFCADTQELPFNNPDNIAFFKAIRARNENLPVAEKTKQIRDILMVAPRLHATYICKCGEAAQCARP